jgi:hypothetical protein
MDENTPHAAPAIPPPLPPAAPAPPPPYVAPMIIERKSGFLAGLLSFFVPGLGHLYLGAYQRALYIFGGLALAIVLVSTGAWPFGFGIAFVWFFGIVDSVRLARAINLGIATEGEAAWEAHVKRAAMSSTASLTWGVILIGLGVLWLVDKYTNIDWSFMHEWGWAACFILFGLILVATHIRRKRRENEAGIGMPPRSS